MAAAVPVALTRWFTSSYPTLTFDPEWLTPCIEYLTEHMPNLSPQQLIKQVESQLLFADLSSATLPPSHFPSPLPQAPTSLFPTLKHAVLVQIIAVEEIGHAALGQYDVLKQKREARKVELGPPKERKDGEEEEKDGRYPRGMVKLKLSDGHRVVEAIEWKRIAGLGLEEVKLGMKLMLHDVKVTKGMLLLSPASVVIKGSAVEEFEAEAESQLEARLRERLNLGPLPPPAAPAAPPPPAAALAGREDDHDELMIDDDEEEAFAMLHANDENQPPAPARQAPLSAQAGARPLLDGSAPKPRPPPPAAVQRQPPPPHRQPPPPSIPKPKTQRHSSYSFSDEEDSFAFDEEAEAELARAEQEAYEASQARKRRKLSSSPKPLLSLSRASGSGVKGERSEFFGGGGDLDEGKEGNSEPMEGWGDDMMDDAPPEAAQFRRAGDVKRDVVKGRGKAKQQDVDEDEEGDHYFDNDSFDFAAIEDTFDVPPSAQIQSSVKVKPEPSSLDSTAKRQGTGRKSGDKKAIVVLEIEDSDDEEVKPITGVESKETKRSNVIVLD